jgi:cytoskeleton protein RodZ
MIQGLGDLASGRFAFRRLNLSNTAGEMAKITRLTLDQGGALERRRLHLREISDGADAPLETVGQDLRKARQLKGEDLAQISRVLKIRKDHLEALEESNFDAMPGRAYTIGFVRAYASYLGLDDGECVERLKAEIAGRSDAREAVQVSTPRDRKLPPGGIVLVLLLLAAVVYGVYYLFIAVNRMGTPPVTPVPARLAEQAGLAPAPAQPPSSPAAAPNSTPDAAVNAPAKPDAAALPQGTKYGAQNATSRITLLVHRPGRVTILGADKKIMLDRVLQPGDSYQVPNMVGLTLSAADGGALEVILDGSPAGYVGKDGATAQGWSLNPQDIVDRQAHG